MSDSTHLASETSDTPNTDMYVTVRVDALGESHHVVPADFARDQERRIAELEAAMNSVRESLKCTKTAPHSYDADHHCDTCGSSSAYAKDLIDEVIRP